MRWLRTPVAAAPREPTRYGTPRAAAVYLAVIIVSWAGNWPLMKLALADAEPLVFVSLRMVGSVAILAAALLVLRRSLLPAPGERLGLFWISQLQVSLFLIFAIIGLALVPAGRAIVLAYTMPLWAIPIELWLGVERASIPKLAGAAVGFGGLVLFMNPALLDWRDPRALAGNASLLLAAIAWALGSVLYRRRQWRTNFWTQTFWQLAAGAPLVLGAGLVGAPDWSVRWTPGLVAILAYNWVVTTALGYFLWARILTVVPAALAGQVLTLTPVGGFLLSIFLFGGSVGVEVAVSIALILAGLVLSLRPARR
jgi:drug/metabolite transporter (DMT)-like permease